MVGDRYDDGHGPVIMTVDFAVGNVDSGHGNINRMPASIPAILKMHNLHDHVGTRGGFNYGWTRMNPDCHRSQKGRRKNISRIFSRASSSIFFLGGILCHITMNA